MKLTVVGVGGENLTLHRQVKILVLTLFYLEERNWDWEEPKMGHE